MTIVIGAGMDQGFITASGSIALMPTVVGQGQEASIITADIMVAATTTTTTTMGAIMATEGAAMVMAAAATEAEAMAVEDIINFQELK